MSDTQAIRKALEPRISCNGGPINAGSRILTWHVKHVASIECK